MKKPIHLLSIVLLSLLPLILQGQITSLTDAQGLTAGTYTFNLGDGDFQGYVDEEGWILWLQYQHQGGTNPNLRVIEPGNDLPIYDDSPLGADLSGDESKWGHGAQSLAASIPDEDLWLRWEAETSNHARKIHFESPVLGKFQSDTDTQFAPEITYKNVKRADHTANLPDKSGNSNPNSVGNNVFTRAPIIRFNTYAWEINTGGRWTVDDVRNDDGTLIQDEHSTIHRIWVKPVPFDIDILFTALDQLQNHINGVDALSSEELNQVKNTIYIYSDDLAASEALMINAQSVMADYDEVIGALFTTPSTQNGFSKDAAASPGLEVERAMLALQQGLFDFVFTPEVYAQYPDLIDGFKYNSCVSFPGDVDPPADATVSNTTSIRANFADPVGINPSYNINGDGTEHAYRPTGMYLAPGSVATVTVPASLVGKDYYIRVGAHEWDLNNKPSFRRLDRITKKFAIESTSVDIFNPLGGAIAILVPYQASEGIVDISVTNGTEAPFYSIKSFHVTSDFDAELDKPAPWAVFETDNVMYTIPTHSIVAGEFDLRQTMLDWDKALQAINTILGRQPIGDKHDMYMITDLMIRGGAFSIGYPMSNNQINYASVPGPVNFIDGPGPRQEVNFHEYGHAVRISKFPGEGEALVNFLYIMALNYGLDEDLNEAVKFSFVPNTFDIDNAARHRMLSNSFGAQRDITNSTTNEVRYQHRGYAHYFEIVNLLGWCPHKNFWESEFIDFENGMDRDINDQDIDSRILRMSIAAAEDLRPLFHVFGILPQDPESLQAALMENGISESLVIYNRLQEYLDLIPQNSEEFLEYALEIYPNLNSSGPTSNPDFGVGWHYLKSLAYDNDEAQERESTLQSIKDLYFSNGAPVENGDPVACCLADSLNIELIDGGIIISGGIQPYTVMVDTLGSTQSVLAIDVNGCETSAEFILSSLSESDIESISIYPNPASTDLFIDLKDNHAQIENVKLISSTGQVIGSYLGSHSKIDVSHVNEGVYIVQIVLTDGSEINTRVFVLKLR